MSIDAPPVDDLDRLLELLVDDVDALAERIAERFRAGLPTYAQLSDDEVRQGLLETTVQLAHAMRERRGLDPAELAGLEEHGERRARQGVGLEELLHAWRVSRKTVLAEARLYALADGLGERAVLDFDEALHDTIDAAAVASARGHQRIALQHARRDETERHAFVRDLLTGALAPADIRVRALGFGLDPERSYRAFRARPADCEPMVERRLRGDGMVAVIAGDIAGFRFTPPPADLPLACGVGPPVALVALRASFRLATRALDTATAFSLTGPRSFAELGLLPAVLADAEVGDELSRAYVEPVLARRSGETLLDSAFVYLDAGRRMREAAARLHVHPNTLRYRIDRYEVLTGVDLDDVECAMRVWWALQRHHAH
jgi:hypothetical protein